MVVAMASQVSAASPTSFHMLLSHLAKSGKLLRLYTQNIDYLDSRLSDLSTHIPLTGAHPFPRTVQLHGTLSHMHCTKCHYLELLNAQLFTDSCEEAPVCPECDEMEAVRKVAGKRKVGVGRLRPRIVLYNEMHPDSEAIGKITETDLKARPDALVVVGTSMKIPGVKRMVREMCKAVRSVRGGRTIWINSGQTPPLTGGFDQTSWDIVVDADCQTVAHLVDSTWEAASDLPKTPTKQRKYSMGAGNLLTPAATPTSQDISDAASTISNPLKRVKRLCDIVDRGTSPSPCPSFKRLKHAAK